MNKKTKYTIYGGIAGGIINGVLNIINQNNEQPDVPIDWLRALKATLKGAAVCGTGGFLVGAYVDYRNSLEKPIDTDLELGSLIMQVQLRQNDRKYLVLCEKTDWLISKIKNEYTSDLKGEPFRFGSTEEGTALKEKYDIDVSMSFKPGAFASTYDMYEILYELIRKMEGENGLLRVRKQTVSLGVYFDLGYGQEGKVDIVPIKITKRKGNKTSGYIYKKSRDLFSTNTYQKTDTYLLSKERLSKTQKEILVALKCWKRKQGVPVSSHLLQNLIKDAYAYNVNKIPYGLTRKIIMVLSHIKDNIDSIYLTSIENSNNVITNIPDSDKVMIREACKKVIEDYNYQTNSIVNYFV
ncbi:hypothetical protein [Foetidibacter luteolus]|uniref:hypothetical protein n=1 Tax=Foetidibacter luteolus TaxID=2608880 RepID=UPI00129A121C|nr:hypothetical protein [Foetidibacter luteolus]